MDKYSETNLLDEAILEEVDDNNGAHNIKKTRPKKVSFDDIAAEIQALNIQNFPKEFRKPVLQNFDKRFLFSLILSLVVHIVLLYTIPRIIPDEFEQTVIKKMHQRFVDTVLQESQQPGSSGSSFSGETVGAVGKKTAPGMSRIIDEIIAGIVAEHNNLPDFSDTPNESQSTGKLKEAREKLVPSAEARQNARKLSSDRKQKVKSQNAKGVENIGLLGIVTTGNDLNDHDYVADIIENANKSGENLEGILKQVNALKVPRYRRPTAYQDVDDVSVGLKTGRITKKEEKDFYSNVAPLAKIEQVDVARNLDVDMTGSPLAGLNRKKAANGKTRTSKHISRVVNRHSRVIQDCYKQVLKHQPGLKGRMVVHIEVDTAGKVVHAEIINSTLNNPKIEQCILRRIRRWNDFGPCAPKLGVMSFKIPYKFGE